MTASCLTPKQAANIARGVYNVRLNTLEAISEGGIDLAIEGLFGAKAGAGRRFEGRSGGLLAIKAITGFGYLASGIGGREGELLVATRGTDIGVDWLSNFNMGLARGPTGDLVHAGFHDVWKSFRPEIERFVAGRRFSRVHCVGHSLGGALANLNAAWFAARGQAEVSLYTFGAPRIGLSGFHDALIAGIGATSIYRVRHVADPVPMIPIFPFQHVSDRRGGYLLKAGGGLVNPAAHSMLGSYIPGVGESDWRGLGTEADEASSDARIKQWIEASANGGAVQQYSATALGSIARALNWLIRQAGALVGVAAGSVLVAGATALDQVVWLLSQAAQLSKQIAGHLVAVMAAALRFIGKTMVSTAQMTAAFLSWVLGMLWSNVQSIAVRALSAIGLG